ncbi:MAG: (Fe-S)-binding protein [Hyphomicrobiales bacterium]
MNTVEQKQVHIKIMSDIHQKGEEVEWLFWVGSAGAFDERYKKVTRAFAKLLAYADVNFAILGAEESDSGDVAKRTGNEMLFQMQAITNVEVLNSYGINKIVTCDPHDFNILQNEYPEFGGKYTVYHHTQLIVELIRKNKITIPQSDDDLGKTIVFHDPCYLGRGNGEYNAPRFILDSLPYKRVEMPRHKSSSLCCGAGGGQMFKESEKGDKEVYEERSNEAINTGAGILATACPFCMLMFSDGIKLKDMDDSIEVKDIAEILCDHLGL